MTLPFDLQDLLGNDQVLALLPREQKEQIFRAIAPRVPDMAPYADFTPYLASNKAPTIYEQAMQLGGYEPLVQPHAELTELLRKQNSPLAGAAREDEHLSRALAAVGRSAVSALYVIGNVIDKPFAAFRGILAREPEHLMVLLPFSESYLKGFWEATFPWKVPERHITGREVLEKWGAPKNKPGFHVLADPYDAIYDILGLGVEIFAVPPGLPVIAGPSNRALRILQGAEKLGGISGRTARAAGALTVALADARAFESVGKEMLGKIAAEQWDDAARLGREALKKVGIADVTGMSDFGGSDVAELAAHVNRYLRTLEKPHVNGDLSQVATQVAQSEFASKPHQFLLESIGGGVRTQVESLLRNIGRQPGLATREAAELAPVSPMGKVEEWTGERGRALLAFRTAWPWTTIVPQHEALVELGTGERAQQLAEWLVNNRVTSGLLSFFHWTTGSAANPMESAARQYAADAMMRLNYLLLDTQYVASELLGSLRGTYEGLRARAQAANHPELVKTYDELVRTVGETYKRGSEDTMKFARKMGEFLMGVPETTEHAGDVADLLWRVENYLNNTLREPTAALRQAMSNSGIKVPELLDAFLSRYMPRFKVLEERYAPTLWPVMRGQKIRLPTVAVNQIARDPVLTRPAVKDAYPEITRAGWLFEANGERTWWTPGTAVTLDVGEKGISGYVMGMDDEGTYYLGRTVGENTELIRLPAVNPTEVRFPASPLEEAGPIPRLPERLQKDAVDKYFLYRVGEEAYDNLAIDIRRRRLTQEGKRSLYAFDRYLVEWLRSPAPAWQRNVWLLSAPLPDWYIKRFLTKRLAGRDELVRHLAAFNHEQERKNFWRLLQSRSAEVPAEGKAWGITPEDWASFRRLTPNRLYGVSSLAEYLSRGGAVGVAIDYLKEHHSPGVLFRPEVMESYREMFHLGAAKLGLVFGVRRALAKTILPFNPQEASEVDVERFFSAHPAASGRIKRRVRKAVGLKRRIMQTWGIGRDEWVRLDEGMRRLRFGGSSMGGSFLRELTTDWWRTVEPVTSVPRGLEKRLYVPKEMITRMQKVLDFSEDRSVQYGLEKAIGKVMEVTRFMWTQPFPSFHVRNTTSATVMALMADAPYTPREFFKALGEFTSHLSKGTRPPYANEMEFYRAIQGASRATQAASQYYTIPQRLLPRGLLTRARQDVQKSVVSKVPALSGAATIAKAWAAAGEHAYRVVESTMRGAMYIAARRKGFTPAQAVELVWQVQYNYGRLSPLERRYGNIFMFYSWLRQNLGYMLPRLLLDWRSGPAQVTRAMHRLQAQQPELPEWMREMFAVPVPEGIAEHLGGEPGRQMVIRQWGLPMEDVGMFFLPTPAGGVPMAAMRTSLKMISRMHPLIPGTTRLLFGIEPYTGRPLEYTSGLYGQPTVDAMISMTPLARLASTLRTMLEIAGIDPGQGISRMVQDIGDLKLRVGPVVDLVTGIKTGYYDLEMQKLYDARDALQRILENARAARSGMYYYVPETWKATAAGQAAQQDIRALDALMDAIQKERVRRGYAQPRGKSKMVDQLIEAQLREMFNTPPERLSPTQQISRMIQELQSGAY